MIKRKKYIERVTPMIDTEFIKIITGVRRSGKSFKTVATIYQGDEKHPFFG